MYERFERLAKNKGVTPYKISKDTGVPQPTLSDWKNGKSTPKADKLMKLAEYFGVSVDYLMGTEKPIILAEAFSGLPPEYVKVMLEARDEGFTPEDIELALGMLRMARNK